MGRDDAQSVERQEHIEQMMREHWDKLFSLVHKDLKNPADAEDIVQDAFVCYCYHYDRIAKKDYEAAWLYRVAINKTKNYLKSSWHQRHTLTDEPPVYTAAPGEESELFSTVMSLKEQYCIPLYLFYFEEYSTEEIADILNISRTAVTSRLHRGRNILSDKLRGDVYV